MKLTSKFFKKSRKSPKKRSKSPSKRRNRSKSPSKRRKTSKSPSKRRKRSKSPSRKRRFGSSSPKLTAGQYAAENFIRNNPKATYSDFVKRRGSAVSETEFSDLMMKKAGGGKVAAAPSAGTIVFAILENNPEYTYKDAVRKYGQLFTSLVSEDKFAHVHKMNKNQFFNFDGIFVAYILQKPNATYAGLVRDKPELAKIIKQDQFEDLIKRYGPIARAAKHVEPVLPKRSPPPRPPKSGHYV